ncbi:MAG: iron-sulfur cluster repair di-iron protein [Labilibaculum sp.]|nr:iron-sulfur cluster repair di-iron protein [Labilibaculum sp.]MBI9056873.1 iron-sulfur cluster repair di-iron protein [Labilibaculum sp.]
MISQETSVGDIVKSHFQTVKIFDDHQIDFCCGGKQSLLEACEKKSLNAEELLKKIEIALKEPDLSPNFDHMSLADLMGYIKEKHHSYVREQIPMISKFLNKIETVHGNLHPEIELINYHFKQTVGQLTRHMEQEETELFPLIEQLENGENKTTLLSAEETISTLVKHHENEGSRFEEISALTLGYEVPKGACRTYRATYNYLQAFEKDLHRHVHLENNILFPKAIELEQKQRKNK